MITASNRISIDFFSKNRDVAVPTISWTASFEISKKVERGKKKKEKKEMKRKKSVGGKIQLLEKWKHV